ncbi:MAG: PDDEXK nuclease domain-containing protein [Nanoarchaeota archaeon]|nr:PDDEXK nuclease domain-containing protein [Nanoarchaeota archaeon]
MLLAKNKEYLQLLHEIKVRVRSAQIKAAISVNKELMGLYWDVGKMIAERQAKGRWGDSVVDMLASDLRREFPDMKGFSRANIFNIRQWHPYYSAMDEKVQQLVRQLPWGHNMTIVNKIKDPLEAVFYLAEAIRNNWSRNVLIHQIESGLYQRKGKVLHNFEATLPAPQSDLARQTLKDPYIFDFLSLGEEAQEREIEKELTKHITKFLLELGAGFSFVGSQYPLEISGKDYYIDLLFYHLKLRCFVVIELKAGEFKPEYAGKLNFYLSAVDKTLKQEEDKPSMGIILCKSKDKVIAEYALKDMSKPMGVSEYKIVRAIPEKLKTSLPTIAELEKELSGTEEKGVKRKSGSRKK